MNNASDSWSRILEHGEAILWQGRPDASLSFDGPIGQSIFGIPFLGFALFWTYSASWMSSAASDNGVGPPGLSTFFPLFGLPFVAVGLYLVVGRYFWRTYVRRRTWYTLTNRRAIITSNVFGRRTLRSWQVEDIRSPELEEAGQLGTVWFASETKRGENHDYEVKIGFERIDGARDVLRKISDARKALAT